MKAPPIPVFSGGSTDRSSVNVKGFIFNVKRIGRLSNTSDEGKLLELAACHFQDRAAAWFCRLESCSNKPTNIEELQVAMMKEFVPTNEKARARIQLMKLQTQFSMDSHISKFIDLVELCDTPAKEAYTFFFMSVTDSFKSELAKKFPLSDPNRCRKFMTTRGQLILRLIGLKIPRVKVRSMFLISLKLIPRRNTITNHQRRRVI